jgi:hypothetical protein
VNGDLLGRIRLSRQGQRRALARQLVHIVREDGLLLAF